MRDLGLRGASSQLWALQLRTTLRSKVGGRILYPVKRLEQSACSHLQVGSSTSVVALDSVKVGSKCGLGLRKPQGWLAEDGNTTTPNTLGQGFGWNPSSVQACIWTCILAVGSWSGARTKDLGVNRSAKPENKPKQNNRTQKTQ